MPTRDIPDIPPDIPPDTTVPDDTIRSLVDAEIRSRIDRAYEILSEHGFCCLSLEELLGLVDQGGPEEELKA